MRDTWSRKVGLCALAVASGLAMVGCAEGTEATEGLENGPPLPITADGKFDGATINALGPLAADANVDLPFSALFAPDDPVTSLELSLIERIRESRQSDPSQYEDGHNPYSIRYAVYNLRNPLIVDALADAADEGVDVQILIDGGQLDPARTWNTADETLIERGFSFMPDHRELSAETLLSADLIGIERSGLMHLKARLFESPEFTRLLTGSMNPGDNAVFNEETLHLVADPTLIARYQAAYEAVRAGNRIDNEWNDAAAVNVLFTPANSGPRAGGRLLSWIAEEQELILIMIYSMRNITGTDSDTDLLGALAERAAAGVPVYVITDRKQSDGVDANGEHVYRNDNMEDRLREAGVHVYEATNRRTEFTAMHHKAGIFGLSHIRVVTDAANWTYSGLGSRTRIARNVESQLFIDTNALDEGLTGRRYLAQWLRVLERYADQSAEDGEPGFREVYDALTSLPEWPTETLEVVATAGASYGESLYVRGSHPAIGDWGAGGLGAPLGTDAYSYPTWQSEPLIELPVGASIEWKLTASYGAAYPTRWERGENRRTFMQPAPLSATQGMVEEVSWRR